MTSRAVRATLEASYDRLQDLAGEIKLPELEIPEAEIDRRPTGTGRSWASAWDWAEQTRRLKARESLRAGQSLVMTATETRDPLARDAGRRWMASQVSQPRGNWKAFAVDRGGGRTVAPSSTVTPAAGSADILTAAQLEPTDLFPEPRTGHEGDDRGEPDPYHDEGGAHLYDVVRFESEGFPPAARDGTLVDGGRRRVLFRLPSLHGQSVVYIVEGEKDVDRLRSIELGRAQPATRAAREELERRLRGAAHGGWRRFRGVILPDNDDPGRQHAAAVAASCQAAGLRVRIVALPGLREKGDASSWLDAGHPEESELDRAGGRTDGEPYTEGGDRRAADGPPGPTHESDRCPAAGGADRRRDRPESAGAGRADCRRS